MPEVVEIFAVAWVLIGSVFAAIFMFFCAGSIGPAVARVVKTSWDYILISVLLVLVLAWAIATGPFWLLAIAIAGSVEEGFDA